MKAFEQQKLEELKPGLKAIIDQGVKYVQGNLSVTKERYRNDGDPKIFRLRLPVVFCVTGHVVL